MAHRASYQLGELTLAEVRARPPQVAILPFGATEPHNLHLPYATDTWLVTEIASRVAEAANHQGASVMVLPTFPFGTETNLAGFPLAINVNPSTMLALIRDLVYSLADHGVNKIVLMNGHGGNDFKPVLRELYGQTAAHLFLINWYTVASDVYHELFEEPDDHAGEMETSLALALFPQWVSRGTDGSLMADEGDRRATQFEAINRGWVSITRPWHLLTTNSGAGNPHRARAEKGARLLDLLVERLAPFLTELSQATLSPQFPYE